MNSIHRSPYSVVRAHASGAFHSRDLRFLAQSGAIKYNTSKQETICPGVLSCETRDSIWTGWVGRQGQRMRDKTIYTTKEVADLAAQYGRSVTQEYIRRLCKTGRIQAIRPSRDWLIAASEAMRWLASWLKG